MLKSVYIVLYRIKDGRKERLKGKSLHVGVKKKEKQRAHKLEVIKFDVYI